MLVLVAMKYRNVCYPVKVNAMANLSDLVLLRNSPAVAREFLQAAIRGDMDAQYGMGLIYAEGRGVRQDEASSFYWLSRAVEQGDRDAEVLRRIVAVSMTAEQFDEVERLRGEYAAAPGPADEPVRRWNGRQYPGIELN